MVVERPCRGPFAKRSYGDGDGLRFYDLYSEFGLALGDSP